MCKCSVCLKPLKWNQPNYECSCGTICHVACIQDNSVTTSWSCQKCIANALPFNHIIDEFQFKSTIRSFFNADAAVNVSNYEHLEFDLFSLNDLSCCPLDNHIYGMQVLFH